MTEYTIAQFTAGLSTGLTPISAKIARTFGFKGGGAVECWVLVEYLLSIPGQELGPLDYWREYPKVTHEGSKKIDLAFNTQTVNPNCPPILSEWKCSPDQNTLVRGFYTDLNKFSPVLQSYADVPLKPYPFFVGIAPMMQNSNVGLGISATPLGNGIGLFLSTKATWAAVNVVQWTAYANDPSIPEQPVMAGTRAVPV
jgi:hypothetical protein